MCAVIFCAGLVLASMMAAASLSPRANTCTGGADIFVCVRVLLPGLGFYEVFDSGFAGTKGQFLHSK
jgi:hypothetical protein